MPGSVGRGTNEAGCASTAQGCTLPKQPTISTDMCVHHLTYVTTCTQRSRCRTTLVTVGRGAMPPKPGVRDRDLVLKSRDHRLPSPSPRVSFGLRFEHTQRDTTRQEVRREWLSLARDWRCFTTFRQLRLVFSQGRSRGCALQRGRACLPLLRVRKVRSREVQKGKKHHATGTLHHITHGHL